MQRKTSHWLIRMAFLSLSITLITGALRTAMEAHPPEDADKVEIQSGPPIAVEEQESQSPTPIQPLPPSGLEQPWQTSWEAFCGELQRLYKRGATEKEMNALFTGKPITWEGVTNSVDRENSFIWLENKECQVTTADNHSASATTSLLLFFAKIPDDLRESAKVRFSMEGGVFSVGGREWYDDVYDQWLEEREPEARKSEARKPEEGRPIEFSIFISGNAKLLEYEKVGDNPLEKLPEDSERGLEGTGKK
jgi:hypothetical protein